MELAHRFNVPTPVEETWAHFNDIAALAECFPGAQVTEADEESFSGSVKVKLGPIALVYNGSGTFVEKDEATHRFVVDANGKDKRGNGTAGAKITASMTAAEGGSTDVEVLTDLAITGKPAQFGRGVMQDVSDKLLGQFVACLEARLSPDAPADASVPEAGPAAVAGEPSVVADDTPVVAGEPSVGEPASSTTPPPRPAPTPPQEDSLNLGTTVLPILLKAYWKPIAGAVVVLLVLIKWLSR
jgi:uncharacterized protein